VEQGQHADEGVRGVIVDAMEDLLDVGDQVAVQQAHGLALTRGARSEQDRADVLGFGRRGRLVDLGGLGVGIQHSPGVDVDHRRELGEVVEPLEYVSGDAPLGQQHPGAALTQDVGVLVLGQ
jgi:hypothetical protein